MGYICEHHRQEADCDRCAATPYFRMAYEYGDGPKDFGQQIINGGSTATAGPSMDLYHLMNAGLLFSGIGLVVAVLYVALGGTVAA